MHNRSSISDECNVDSDCKNGGKCIDTYAISSPRLQCFCAAGYFGDKCTEVNEASFVIVLVLVLVIVLVIILVIVLLRFYNCNSLYAEI